MSSVVIHLPAPAAAAPWWWVPISSAFAVAALALVGNIVFEVWKRSWDKRGAAGAIAGELGGMLENLRPHILLPHLRNLAVAPVPQVRPVLPLFGPLPSNFPVFDRVAEKISLFSSRDAREISRIYNIVAGMRLILTNLGSDRMNTVPDQGIPAMFTEIANTLDREIPVAQALIDRLTRMSERRYLWVL
jgi:hypothetical protein